MWLRLLLLQVATHVTTEAEAHKRVRSLDEKLYEVLRARMDAGYEDEMMRSTVAVEGETMEGGGGGGEEASSSVTMSQMVHVLEMVHENEKMVEERKVRNRGGGGKGESWVLLRPLSTSSQPTCPAYRYISNGHASSSSSIPSLPSHSPLPGC